MFISANSMALFSIDTKHFITYKNGIIYTSKIQILNNMKNYVSKIIKIVILFLIYIIILHISNYILPLNIHSCIKYYIKKLIFLFNS